MEVFTQYSVSKILMRFLKYLEGDPHDIFPQRLILIKLLTKGGAAHRKAKLFCFHQSSYSILTTTQTLKPVPSCILNRTPTGKHILHWGKVKENKILFLLWYSANEIQSARWTYLLISYVLTSQACKELSEDPGGCFTTRGNNLPLTTAEATRAGLNILKIKKMEAFFFKKKGDKTFKSQQGLERIVAVETMWQYAGFKNTAPAERLGLFCIRYVYIKIKKMQL